MFLKKEKRKKENEPLYEIQIGLKAAAESVPTERKKKKRKSERLYEIQIGLKAAAKSVPTEKRKGEKPAAVCTHIHTHIHLRTHMIHTYTERLRKASNQ